jgi:hypothetical protein
MQRFVMFAMPRTGSSWLRTALDSHPDITCYAALFRNHRWGKNEFRQLQQSPDLRFYEVDYRMANFEAALEAVFEATPPVKHVGLKHMAGAQPKIRDHLAKDPQYRKVILRRDNLLAVYASNLLVKATGQGSARRNVEVKRAPILFDKKEFKVLSSRYEEKYRELRALCAGGVIEVTYNSLRQGEDMTRLAEFFDIDPAQMVLDTTRKRGNDSIVDRFENRDDTLAYLKEIDHDQWAVER